jgi:hypothetical protein
VTEATRDRSLTLFVGSRAWNSLSGILTLWLIVRQLTAEQQGHYYLLLSLASLQMFAELGLSVAVTNLVSPEMAHVTLNGVEARGPIASINRLYSLRRFANRWFNGAAAMLVVVLPIVGWLFFSTDQKGTNSRNTFVPWVIYVFGIALSLVAEGQLSFLLGVGRSKLVGWCRVQQAVASSFLLWTGLLFGLKLFALGVSVAVPAVVNLLVVRITSSKDFKILKSMAQGPGLNWRNEIWPFQWRIGISFLSGFFTSQSLIPIVHRQHGAEVAGRVGISLQIVMSVNAVAFAWVGTKSSRYGLLLARGENDKVRREFRASSIGSLVLVVSSFLAATGVLWFMRNHPLAKRVLPMRFFLWMCLLGLANHISWLFAAFLRSLRSDPLWAVSIAHGLSTTVVLLLLPESKYSGVLVAMTVGILAIALPSSFGIFLPAWHRVIHKRCAIPVSTSLRQSS